MPRPHQKHLPRLASENYQGRQIVFWTQTTEHRAAGWLNEKAHGVFRELLLHVAIRECLVCPVYTLMPDHVHVVWMGIAEGSDQRRACSFLRTRFQRHLSPCRWQHQPHDHVLRESERERNAFESICHYVVENPVRKGLVSGSLEWPYTGSMVPGYPDVHPCKDGFWGLFWRVYNACVERGSLGKL